MNEIEFSFDELPLIVEGGFEAALIDGSATIRYEDIDGEWSVVEIALDGSRLRSSADPCPLVGGMFERKPVPLCKASYPWPYGAIIDRLESIPRFRNAIDGKIVQAIEDARDGRRARCDDPDAQHSTLNHAQQGIAPR